MSGFRLISEITYWVKTGNNGTGGKTWANGVKVDAGVFPSDDTAFTTEGKEITASKAVYTRVSVPNGAYVIEADHEGTSEPVDGAQLVVKSSSNSTLSDMYRALLQ